MENRAARHDVSAFAGQPDVRFRFVNGPSADAEDGVILDDLKITGNATAAVSPVETKISKLENIRIPKGGNTEFFSSNGKLMCSIENLDTNTMSIPQLTIDGEGNGAWSLAGRTAASEMAADKTYYLSTPILGHGSKRYHARITLYYTAEEIAGWETATGNKRSDIVMCRTLYQDIPLRGFKEIGYGLNQKIENVFNGDFSISAEFTDLIGGGIGIHKPSATGVLESGELSDKLFYPNPATDEVTVAHEGATGVELRDAAGRTVLAVALNGGNFSVRGLPAGMYTAVVLGRTGAIAVGKFMKK